MTELNSLAILTLLKQTGLHITNDLTGSLLIKALTGLQPTLQQTVLLIQICYQTNKPKSYQIMVIK